MSVQLVPTISVIVRASGAEAVIRTEDFRPDLHDLPGSTPSSGEEKEVVAETTTTEGEESTSPPVEESSPPAERTPVNRVTLPTAREMVAATETLEDLATLETEEQNGGAPRSKVLAAIAKRRAELGG